MYWFIENFSPLGDDQDSNSKSKINLAFEISDEGFESIVDVKEVETDPSRYRSSIAPHLEDVLEDNSEKSQTSTEN